MKPLKIVFLDPPSPPGFVSFRHAHGGLGEFCHSSRLKVPTLDLFHAASLILENGFDAAIVDSVLADDSIPSSVRAVLAAEPSWVAVRTASGSCPHDLKTAKAIRKRYSGPIVFFGPHAAAESEFLLSSGAVDAVVTGEAPPILLAAARAGGFAGVPGLRTLDKGRLVDTGPAPFMREVDALPVPRWDLVPYRKYSFITAQTSWGCPMGCGYCPYPVTQGTLWRTRSASKVVAEFSALRVRYGLRFVMLRDPLFTLDRERTLALCAALTAAGVPIMWGCETRLDALDEELISAMARAGCVRVVFGVESVSEKVLRRAGRKGMAKAAIQARVASLKSRGMLTYAFYMIGLPGETTESTLETIDFALELDTNAASFSAATPFQGTALQRTGSSKGLIETDDPLHLSSCVPAMGSGAMDAAEIGRLYRLAKRRWKGRKAAAGFVAA